MTSHPEIGPRQTVDRAKHPTLGEGRLVHRNGPAFFVADSGEWCALKDVRWGGWSAARDGKPERSYDKAVQDGALIELETTGRQRGDTHRRIWSPLVGCAWMVNVASAPKERAIIRIEPDGGKPFEFEWRQWVVGMPEHFADKTTKKLESDRVAAGNAGWQSYKGDFGTFAFCHEEDADKARYYLEHRNDPAPPKAKKDRTRKASGPLPDFANMTRSEIEAWEKGA